MQSSEPNQALPVTVPHACHVYMLVYGSIFIFTLAVTLANLSHIEVCMCVHMGMYTRDILYYHNQLVHYVPC